MRARARGRGPAFVLLLSLLTAAWATGKPRVEVSPLERWLRDGLAPVDAAVAEAARRWLLLGDLMARWRSLAEENERLRAEVARLSRENLELAALRRENAALREALGLLADTRHALPAQVIRRPLGNWWGTLLIDRGARDGVYPGLPVVTADGIVGQVQSVTERTAEVLLFVDPRSAIGGVVERTGDVVLVEGAGSPRGLARIRTLSPDPQLAPGDRVVTSGLSRLFPPGLPIGTITHTSEPATGLTVEGILEPLADLRELAVVSVLVEGPGPERGEGPPPESPPGLSVAASGPRGGRASR